jgi:phosphatidylglycerol:prolipoprotein diacylglycerol transferase
MIPYFTVLPVEVGGLRIQPFGVLLLLGVGAGIVVFGLALIKRDLAAWPVLICAGLAPLCIPAAHVAYVFANNPAALHERGLPALLEFTQGLSPIGFFLTWVPLCLMVLAIENVRRFGAQTDSLAIGLAVAWAVGRLGCTVVHDHPGIPTRFFLGVQGICPTREPGVACHDLGMYELMYTVTLVVALALLDRWRTRPGGFQAALLPLTYGPFRFFADFLRPEHTDLRWGGLTAMQWFAIPLIVIGIVSLWLVRRSREEDSTDHPWRPPGVGLESPGPSRRGL